MEIEGLFHIHSLYSYDSTLTMKEIVEICKKNRYSFVILIEHQETMTENKMEEYIRDCVNFSTGTFMVVPGIEISCYKGIHILGIGVSSFITSDEPLRVIEKIKGIGGLAVLAHPYKNSENNIDITSLIKIDGIEVWNGKTDGRYGMNIRSFNLLGKFRKYKKKIFFYAGLDLHKTQDFFKLTHVLKVKALNQKEILNSLQEGNFYIKRNSFLCNATGRIKKHKMIYYSGMKLVHNLYAKSPVKLPKMVKKYFIKYLN